MTITVIQGCDPGATGDLSTPEGHPFRLISDPECALSEKVGAVREQHWSGPMVHATTYLLDAEGIVRWRFQSKMAQRRPSPISLANMAGAVAKRPVPEYIDD